ncbi:hypothetical protein [Marixanthomonas spongiae]|uniref:Uncharacterized protein n=1 Tax=Marixanthomonas spongiae TaxID=2174845 RepID=A0A2U0I0V4_9FLAO|nr:hypothetical protein [Marixanthomonas spongiae]PVW14729.1 hypothetical protein DDV96_09440 [Marixanthomonas spongiae]
MKNTIIGFLLLLLLIPSISYAQFWPFTPMDRFGNTVYYQMDGDGKIELKGSNKLLGKNLENRYFDVLSHQDDIQVKINDTSLNFTQKKRREPKNHKEILFYSRRKLKNDLATIKYLKLLELKENVLIAEATIKYKTKSKKRTKELVEIDRNQLKGIFLGPGKNLRTITSVVAFGGTIILILLI